MRHCKKATSANFPQWINIREHSLTWQALCQFLEFACKIYKRPTAQDPATTSDVSLVNCTSGDCNKDGECRSGGAVFFFYLDVCRHCFLQLTTSTTRRAASSPTEHVVAGVSRPAAQTKGNDTEVRKWRNCLKYLLPVLMQLQCIGAWWPRQYFRPCKLNLCKRILAKVFAQHRQGSSSISLLPL